MGSFYVLELKQLFLLPLGTLEWWRQTWTAKDNCCRTVEENKVLFFWKPKGCVLIWTYLIWNYFHFRTVTKRLEITVFLDVNTDITKKISRFVPEMLSWHGGSLFPQGTWIPRLDQTSKSNGFCSLMSSSVVCSLGEEHIQSWGVGADKKMLANLFFFFFLTGALVLMHNGRMWHENRPGPAGSVLSRLTLMVGPGCISALPGSQESWRVANQPMQEETARLGHLWDSFGCWQ